MISTNFHRLLRARDVNVRVLTSHFHSITYIKRIPLNDRRHSQITEEEMEIPRGCIPAGCIFRGILRVYHFATQRRRKSIRRDTSTDNSNSQENFFKI
ncbi:hypothetical protein PUN28_005471 [Cardiocondyla obscurior]|uniref:Uncharacterized protein n=1 Tax=Cardiocondyla obscurior TaxID=286306 RepID=A0AAW2GL23_9HYME